MTDIRIITEPSVRVVTRQRVDYSGLDALMGELGCQWESDAGEGPEAIPEVAGRLCYLSYPNPRPGGNAAYLRHILEAGHGRVLEHAVFGLLLTGISRSLSHELITHKAGASFSELSQRYVDCSGVAFVLPPAIYVGKKLADREIEQEGGAYSQHYHLLDAYWRWFDACGEALMSYEYEVESLTATAPAELTGTERRKWARQAARSVLPNCTETKVFMTANARCLRNMIEMRASRHADAEIRNLFCKVHDVLKAEAINLFGDYERVELPDGYELVTKYRKV